MALQTYQRHQVPPSPELYGWNQFRGADGQPGFPQRPVLVGPIVTVLNAGELPNGHVRGKVLVLEVTMDIDALPWQADWYRSRVKDALGADFEDNFAIWFIDHAQHDNPPTKAACARTVSYEGALQQGLRDLAAWVERGVRPPDTRYEVVDSQVKVPPRATDRGGIQPVVELTVNGGLRAEVAAGEAVALEAFVEVPSAAGKVIAAEWCFEGTGDYATAAKIDVPEARISLLATHTYSEPGTYFPVLRATSQREGDNATRYGRIQNIARARVVAH